MKSLGLSDREINSSEDLYSDELDIIPEIRVSEFVDYGTGQPKVVPGLSQRFRWSTLKSAYFSIGVIFGDIGTSPIYAYRTIFASKVATEEKVFGVTSLIIWSFILIVCLKYLFVILNADDNGKGGSFAMYSILCRHLGIDASGEGQTLHNKLDRELTTYSNYEAKRPQAENSIFKRSSFARVALLSIVLFSSALILGDGVLTPAVSVLSSVEGLAIEAPSLSSVVLPACCMLLFTIFVIQGLGTHKLSSSFSPVVILWLISNASIGLYNVIMHHPSILKAFSPHYAAVMFYKDSRFSWQSLQGVLLCITGAEALFADMGHFSRPAIRIAALVVVVPMLILTYLGQASYIIKFSGSVTNPFWDSIPQKVYWAMFVLSLFVTVIASQALISASFSIVHQAVSINCFPPIRICHTSRTVYGQIYASSLNYILMFLSMMTVLIFKTTENLTSAYGIAVSIVMLLSTIIVSVVMRMIWEWHWSLVVLFATVYLIIDGTYMSSNLLKISQWGWYPLVLAIAVYSIMIVWRWGALLTIKASKDRGRSARTIYKSLLEKRQKERAKRPDYFESNVHTLQDSQNNPMGEDLKKIADNMYSMNLKRRRSFVEGQRHNYSEDTGLAKIPGTCIFYTNQHGGIPLVFYQYLETFPAVFTVVIFLHIRRAIVPYVVPEERLRVVDLGYEGFYSVVATYGYMDLIDPGKELALNIINGLKKLEVINYKNNVEYLRAARNSGDDINNVKTTFSDKTHGLASSVEPQKAQNILQMFSIDEESQRNKKSCLEKHEDKMDIVYKAVQEDPIVFLNLRLNHLIRAYSTGVTYIINESHLFDSGEKKWGVFSPIRKFLIETIFNFLSMTTVSAATLHEIPFERSVVLSTKLEG